MRVKALENRIRSIQRAIADEPRTHVFVVEPGESLTDIQLRKVNIQDRIIRREVPVGYLQLEDDDDSDG